MKTLTYEKELAARRAYAAIQKNLQNMGQTVLKLMRHPQAGANQIMECHKAYSAVYASVQQTRGELIKRGVRLC